MLNEYFLSFSFVLESVVLLYEFRDKVIKFRFGFGQSPNKVIQKLGVRGEDGKFIFTYLN